jgi:putative spermidine/putrescine transport system ATP-binding protein
VGLEGKVVDVQYHGPTSRYEVEVGGAVLAVSLPSGGGDAGCPTAGEAVRLAWPRAAMVELSADSATAEDGRDLQHERIRFDRS